MRSRHWLLLGGSSVLAVGACGQVESKAPHDLAAAASGAPGGGDSAIGGKASTAGGLGAGGSDEQSAGAGAGSWDEQNAGAGGVPSPAEAGGAPGAGGMDELGGVGATLNLPPLPAPHPYRAIQIATGTYHTCALLEDHRVKCWGGSGWGQLGLGNTSSPGLDPAFMGDALPAVELGTGRTALAIAAARYSTCAILDDRSAKCWGLVTLLGPSGLQLGDEPGEMGDALAPLPLGGHKAKMLSLGYYGSCVARDDESYLCGSTSNEFRDVAAAGDAHLVSMSADNFAVGLFDDGSARRILEPAGPKVLFEATADPPLLFVGARDQSCVYRTSHELECLSNHQRFPDQLPEVRSLALSEYGRLCGVLSSGEVQCWGDADLQRSWTEATGQGVRVILPAAAAQISSTSDEYHCALLLDGRVTCWSWKSRAPGIGWDDTGATEIRAVDLGTYQGP